MGKSGAIANVLIILTPVLLGVSLSLLVAIPTASLLFVAVVSAVLGVILLSVSKWSKLRAGNLLSLGPSAERPVFRRCYLAAYGCIALSLSGFVALALSLSYG